MWACFSATYQVPLLRHNSISNRFRSWMFSTDHVKKHHIRLLIPVIIGWYVWLARNDAKHRNTPLLAEKIIIRVKNHILQYHRSKPFSRHFWASDLSIATSWHIHLPGLSKVKPKCSNGINLLYTGLRSTQMELIVIFLVEPPVEESSEIQMEE